MNFSSNLTNNWRLTMPHSFSVEQQVELYSEIVREGTQGYSKFSSINETDDRFQSTEHSQPFECPVYSLDPSRVCVFISDTCNPRMRDFISEREIKFPVHPGNDQAPNLQDVVSRPVLDRLVVFPTASTRTVRLWDQRREGFKLDLHKRISRYDRRLGPGTIGHSVEVSRRLSNFLQNNQTSSSQTGIMEEDFGAAFITDTQPQLKGWGFLHRQMELHPLVDKKTYTIPLFSLYGKDPNFPDALPLIIKMLDKFETKKEKTDFVLKHIFFPIIRSWTDVFNHTGIILEPHGQNCRLEFSAENGDEYRLTGRVGHIDFDAAVDVQKLTDLNLDTANLYKGQLITEHDGHEISTIYDKSVGKMLFDELAKVLEKHEGISPEILKEACKKEFERCMPDFDDFFPEKTYRYSDKPKGENSFGYECTGEDPSWRPAKRHENE